MNSKCNPRVPTQSSGDADTVLRIAERLYKPQPNPVIRREGKAKDRITLRRFSFEGKS